MGDPCVVIGPHHPVLAGRHRVHPAAAHLSLDLGRHGTGGRTQNRRGYRFRVIQRPFLGVGVERIVGNLERGPANRKACRLSSFVSTRPRSVPDTCRGLRHSGAESAASATDAALPGSRPSMHVRMQSRRTSKRPLFSGGSATRGRHRANGIPTLLVGEMNRMFGRRTILAFQVTV